MPRHHHLRFVIDPNFSLSDSVTSANPVRYPPSDMCWAQEVRRRYTYRRRTSWLVADRHRLTTGSPMGSGRPPWRC